MLYFQVYCWRKFFYDHARWMLWIFQSLPKHVADRIFSSARYLGNSETNINNIHDWKSLASNHMGVVKFLKYTRTWKKCCKFQERMNKAAWCPKKTVSRYLKSLDRMLLMRISDDTKINIYIYVYIYIHMLYIYVYKSSCEKSKVKYISMAVTMHFKDNTSWKNYLFLSGRCLLRTHRQHISIILSPIYNCNEADNKLSLDLFLDCSW